MRIAAQIVEKNRFNGLSLLYQSLVCRMLNIASRKTQEDRFRFRRSFFESRGIFNYLFVLLDYQLFISIKIKNTFTAKDVPENYSTLTK